LVQLFIELIRQGKKANIKGKEIGSSIITLIDKTRQKTIEGLFKHLLVHRVQMKTKLVQKGVRNIENHPRWVALTEKIEIIKILSKPFNAVSQLKQYIERIFLDENMPGIVLSTIHKAKGLEADKVYILMPSLMPSVYALTDRDLQQEYNLMYVARTRAKKELIYIQYLPEPVKEDDEVDDSKLLKL
jgi:superfamily I DNA/RNA helicase